MKFERATYAITGTLVGHIWMPPVRASKDLLYTFTKDKARIAPVDHHGTLRDALLAITNDGDFQSCVLHGGLLEVSLHYRTTGGTQMRRTKHFELTRFPSINDMVSDEEFFPDEDFEE